MVINMNNEDPIIVFDNSSRELILKTLEFRRYEKSELVDTEGKILTNPEFESIKAEEFGGILKGSKIPIRKNKSELVRYFVSKE